MGIDTDTGAVLGQFLAGEPPLPPIAGCGGPNVVEAGGSTTSIPTRFAIVGAVGDATSGQFTENGTMGSECSHFNFNPFNYYQTPQECFSATVVGHYDINDDVSVYRTFSHTNVTVDTQIAPSGTFGAVFELPLPNPLIGEQARQFMIEAGNTAAAGNGSLLPGGSCPVNANVYVDVNLDTNQHLYNYCLGNCR